MDGRARHAEAVAVLVEVADEAGQVRDLVVVIDQPVAVVVDAIAELRGAWVDLVAAVVAVLVIGEAVPIGVLRAGGGPGSRWTSAPSAQAARSRVRVAMGRCIGTPGAR